MFKQVAVGGFDNNFSYVVGNKGKCFVVDPCGDIDKIVSAAKEFDVIYVVNTHSHHDHIEGNNFFLKKGAKLIDHDFLLEGINVKIIRTPGHTRDSKCILIDNKKLITGDTVFVGCIGRIFFESDNEAMQNSLKNIFKLSDDVEVWPGHDYGDKPYSTIGFERKHNRFLKF